MADYSREQLMRALRKADAAGDVAAAKAIARRIKALGQPRQATSADTFATAGARGQAKPAQGRENKPTSFWQGVAEEVSKAGINAMQLTSPWTRPLADVERALRSKAVKASPYRGSTAGKITGGVISTLPTGLMGGATAAGGGSAQAPAVPPVEMITVKIDGVPVSVPKTTPDPLSGKPIPTTMIQACNAVKVDVPHYCYHPKLPVAGDPGPFEGSPALA